MTQSVIRASDLNINKNAYRTAQKQYYMTYLVELDGSLTPCLLTVDAVDKGIARAEQNPEDIQKLNVLQLLLHKFLSFIGK
jgi:hypothetical protein